MAKLYHKVQGGSAVVTKLPKEEQLNWAASKAAGRITEVAVLAPIKLGCVAGERRTYEERALAVIESFASQIEHGLPNLLQLVPSIHFGRITLIRPEHYLLYSEIDEVKYYDKARKRKGKQPVKAKRRADPAGDVPMPSDPYVELPANWTFGPPPPMADLKLRSFLLTSVEFDGDLRAYFRDIGVQLNSKFNRIFENCENFPGTSNFESFWLWIRRYQISTNLFYSAYPDLSVTRIKALQAFKRNFDAFVAQVRPAGGACAGSMDELFDQFLRENQQIASGFPTAGGMYLAPGCHREDGQ
jgi:hypothetical protein